MSYENLCATKPPCWIFSLQRVRKQFYLHWKAKTTLLYIRSGRLQLNSGEMVEAQQMAVMSNHGEHLEIQAVQDSAFLLLSGQPLNEPIYGRGYFVMNTFTEVLQAYEDLKQGHFIAPNTKPNATDET